MKVKKNRSSCGGVEIHMLGKGKEGRELQLFSPVTSVSHSHAVDIVAGGLSTTIPPSYLAEHR